MSGYRKEWPCCGDETYTEAWEPERCPFCELNDAKDRIAELETELQAAQAPASGEPAYVCSSCGNQTPPPSPFKMYVVCPCGHSTPATVAANLAKESHPPAKVPERYAKEKLTEALRQFRHNSDNTGSADKPEQGFVFGYDKAIVDDLVAMLEAAAGGNWVKCTDRLPEPARNTRRNQHGILVRFDSGRIERFKEVTEYLVNFMKNGPRIPTKYEAPTPERATHWMHIIPPTVQGGE